MGFRHIPCCVRPDGIPSEVAVAVREYEKYPTLASAWPCNGVMRPPTVSTRYTRSRVLQPHHLVGAPSSKATSYPREPNKPVNMLLVFSPARCRSSEFWAASAMSDSASR